MGNTGGRCQACPRLQPLKGHSPDTVRALSPYDSSDTLIAGCKGKDGGGKERGSM